MGGVTIILALQLIWIAWALFRRRLARGIQKSGRWIRSVASVGSAIMWALLILVGAPTALGSPLPTMIQFAPDLMSLAFLSAGIALAWAALRTAFQISAARCTG